MKAAPADREDIKSEAAARLAVYEEFAPADLTEEQIRQVIAGVLAELGIEEPKKSDKGAHYEDSDAEGEGKGRRQGSQRDFSRNAEIETLERKREETAEGRFPERRGSDVQRRDREIY